jgi:hypothetical protein
MTLVGKRALSLVTLLLLALPFAGCAAQSSDDAEEDDAEDEPTEQSNDELRSAVSCKERSDTAYDRGRAYEIKVVHVGGKPVAKATGHAFLKMQKAAHEAGVRLSLTSGFRTMAEQKRLYNCYRTKSCNNGNLAAKPGYSNHQNGLALDVSTSTWLARNASRFGFVRTVKKEAWHYEYTGGRDPGGPCSRQTQASAPAGEGAEEEAPTLRPEALPWVSPTEDSTNPRTLTMKVEARDASIVRVAYHAGNYDLGSSTDVAGKFSLRYTFNVLGERTLSAEGFDARGNKVAESTVDVILE